MTGSLSMIMLDQTVVTVALPSMARELPLSVTGEQWVINAYVVATAALVALGGRLAGRWGPVTTFRVGVSLFVLASLACGATPSGGLGEGWIIATRMLQGAGAALMVPVSAPMVLSAFPPSQRGRAMAAYVGISQVFLAAGPLLGGLLTEQASWRAVFWVNAPVGMIALILVHLARPQNARHPDTGVVAKSAALLIGGVAGTVLAVQQASRWGWDSVVTWLVLALGIAMSVGFVRSTLRSADPLVPLRLLGDRGFRGDVIVLGLAQFGLLPVIVFGSLYLQNVLGLSPMRSGLAVLPLILPVAAAAQLGGRWYDRSGIRPPALAGLALAVVGLTVWAAALPALRYGLQVPGMILTGLGLGLAMSPSNTDALSRVDLAHQSPASGLVETVRQVGSTLGVAVIGSLILVIEHEGARAARPQAAVAVTAGYLGAALVFAAAWVAAYRLLPRDHLTLPGRGGVPSRPNQ